MFLCTHAYIHTLTHAHSSSHTPTMHTHTPIHSYTHHTSHTHSYILMSMLTHTLTHVPYMIIHMHSHSPTCSHILPHTHTYIHSHTVSHGCSSPTLRNNGSLSPMLCPQCNFIHLSHLLCSYLTGHKDMAMGSISAPTKCHLHCSPLNHKPHLLPPAPPRDPSPWQKQCNRWWSPSRPN